LVGLNYRILIGITINKTDLEKVFLQSKPKRIGHLTFEEFKAFIVSEEGNRAFKSIIQNKSGARIKSAKDRFGNLRAYAPTDFRSMLEYISWKLDREDIIKSLERQEKLKQAVDYTLLFKNSDIGEKVSTQNQSKAMKLLVHEAKTRALSANSTTNVILLLI
jgi:hypothetical protein